VIFLFKKKQAIGMFELPKDDKRRKLWTIRVNRRISFNRIALLSRLCANHFTNELAQVDRGVLTSTDWAQVTYYVKVDNRVSKLRTEYQFLFNIDFIRE
jgi:hypothetical protein